MKKHLSLILVVLSLLVAGTGVAAVPMEGRTVKLVGVQYVPGKGPVFTFEVSGNFSRSALKGTVNVQGGGSYTMHCAQVGDTTVRCSASQKIANVNVTVTFGGSIFWTYVSGAPVPAASGTLKEMSVGYCYSIWDWWDFTNYEWTDFGPHCQDEAAAAGNLITYMVPDPAGSYESEPVEFYEEDVSGYCFDPVPYYGPAYYFPGCPELSAN